MDFLDLFRLLPRSVLYNLAHSLVPGTILLFGASYIRWNLVTAFLTFSLIDPVSKAVLVMMSVFASGYLLLTIVGGFLTVFFTLLGVMLGAAFKKGQPAYGRSIVWRRIVSRLLGEQIGRIQEPGMLGEEFKVHLKSMFDKRASFLKDTLSPLGSGPIPEELTSEMFERFVGEPVSFAASELHKAQIDAEWQAIYRIVGGSFDVVSPEMLYSILVLLSSGPLLWVLYHYWLASLFPLWIAGFSATIFGAFSALMLGLSRAVSVEFAVDRAQRADERQAAQILRILIARKEDPPKL